MTDQVYHTSPLRWPLPWFRLYFLYLTLLFAILFIGCFPLILLSLLLPSAWRDQLLYQLLYLMSRVWFMSSGILPLHYHRKRIRYDQPYIIIANHSSYLDAAIIYTVLPRLFKALGKVEIGQVPLYGLLYRAVVVTVDRNSHGGRAMSYRRLKNELDHGVSVLLFPEGTFPDHPSTQLLPFQDGAFSLAITQQKSLLPVLFLDAAQRWHPQRWFSASPGRSRAVFLPPLPVHGFEKNHVVSLRQYTQQYMQTCLDFCRQHSCNDVWVFAQNWLEQHPLPA